MVRPLWLFSPPHMYSSFPILTRAHPGHVPSPNLPCSESLWLTNRSRPLQERAEDLFKVGILWHVIQSRPDWFQKSWGVYDHRPHLDPQLTQPSSSFIPQRTWASNFSEHSEQEIDDAWVLITCRGRGREGFLDTAPAKRPQFFQGRLFLNPGGELSISTLGGRKKPMKHQQFLWPCCLAVMRCSHPLAGLLLLINPTS